MEDFVKNYKVYFCVYPTGISAKLDLKLKLLSVFS